MRQLDTAVICDTVSALYYDACCRLGDGVAELLEEAAARESSPIGRRVLGMLLENAQIAESHRQPLCQDTGIAVVFIDMGQDILLTGDPLEDAINRGISRAQREGLRASTLDPITRINRGDNTPAVIHLRIVSGDKFKLDIAPKGFGSENMSRLGMLTPSVGVSGIESFIVDSVRLAGGNPCPPVIVGVGIGGTTERCMLLAKRALLRKAGAPSQEPELVAMEQRALQHINQLGIGPGGLGGDTTALAVHIEAMPAHIASLPVAVNMQCNAARHVGVVL